MASIVLNKPSGGQMTIQPEDGTTNETIVLPASGIKGTILQVQYVETSPTRYTINNAELVDIPELSIDITRLSTTSSLLLMATVPNTGTYVCSFGFAEDGVNIGGTANTNVSSGAILTTYRNLGPTAYGEMYNDSFKYMHTPIATTATYTVRASSSWSGTTNTMYINDRDSNDMRSISTFLIMEVEN